jgi:hypothetical protein
MSTRSACTGIGYLDRMDQWDQTRRMRRFSSLLRCSKQSQVRRYCLIFSFKDVVADAGLGFAGEQKVFACALSPFGSIELELAVDGSIVRCQHPDGSPGLMFKGEASAQIDGGVGTIIGGDLARFFMKAATVELSHETLLGISGEVPRIWWEEIAMAHLHRILGL